MHLDKQALGAMSRCCRPAAHSNKSGAHTVSRAQIVRDIYRAFSKGDRGLIEQTFSDDFTFSSPLDVGLDRKGYFDRCWPGAGQGGEFTFVRMIESSDEVIVTYEFTNAATSHRGRNTEIFSFVGDKVRAVEVYFGWNVH